MKKEKKYTKKRHKLTFKLARPIAAALGRKYGLKYKKFPLEKGQSYFILGNHQTALDPVFVCLVFDAPVYIVASDTLFNKSIPSRMLRYCFSPVKKKKGAADFACIRNCAKISKEGGNVALFPEGNRAWADFQIYIDSSVTRLIRLLKLPVALVNFKGGYGVSPRWSKELRKGEFTCEVTRVIPVSEINAMTDEELFETVKNGLRVIDSESGKLYKAKARAEFLERELFVCPVCGGLSTLESQKHHVKCRECGLCVEYGEDLLLHSETQGFTFKKLVEWYKFQLGIIKELCAQKGGTEEIIYRDAGVKLFDKTDNAKKIVSEGEMLLTGKNFSVGEFKIALGEIDGASIVGGSQLLINAGEKSYSVSGGERLNALKYALTFNALEQTKMEDNYYGLEL